MLSVFVLLLPLFLYSRSLSVPCSSPVTYNTSEFTIRGPCPNDVLIAPVGNTVQYRCDYEERASGVYLVYWHITELSDSPFLPDEVNNHQIIVVYITTSSTEGYTRLSITVLEQYLNKSLSIQCGLCSISECTREPLSENVTSKPVILVAFSSPSSLYSTIVSNFVPLSWSTPPVSTDFTDPVDFQYEVLLTNMNTSQVYNFTTNDTHLNISQLLLPDDHDICSTYSWSVCAKVEERSILAQSTNDTITIPSGPRILSESIHTNITECKESIVISINLKVESCSDLLHFNVTFEDSADLTIVESDSTVKHLSGNTFVVKSKFIIPDLDEVFNETVNVKVANRFGSQIESYKIIQTFYMCDEVIVIPATTAAVISSNTMLSSVISVSSIHYPTFSVTISPVSINPPPAFSNGRAQYHIYIPVGIAVFVLLVAVIVVVCIIIGLKLHKRKVVLIVTPINESKSKFEPTINTDSPTKTSVSFGSMDIDGSQPPKVVEADFPTYATPFEIKETLSGRSSEIIKKPITKPSTSTSQLNEDDMSLDYDRIDVIPTSQSVQEEIWPDMQYNLCYSSVSNYSKGATVTTQSMTASGTLYVEVEKLTTHLPAVNNDLRHPHSQEAIDDVIAVQDNSAYGSSTAYAAYVNNRAIVSLKQNESYGIIGSVTQF